MIVNVQGFIVEIIRPTNICYPGLGFWRLDKIKIHSPHLIISEKQTQNIIEYLYSEGFIQDRRTTYEIVSKKHK